MPDVLAPAYYATRARGWRRDWIALLHPPYTAWHLSYVVIGAALAPALDAVRLGATLLAFLLALGVAAHALDELRSRPLKTRIPDAVLVGAAAMSLAGAVALGLAGIGRVGVGLLPFILVGVLFVVAYNLELFGGVLHGDFWFALSWGAFPVLTAYFAQAGRLSLAAGIGAAAAFALSYCQRALSTPARRIRRQARSVSGSIVLEDGTAEPLNTAVLLEPLERALRALSWATVALALALAAARFS